MVQKYLLLGSVVVIGLAACVSLNKPISVAECSKNNTCSDGIRDAAIPPSEDGSAPPSGTGGTTSVDGATTSSGGTTSTGGMAPVGGAVATGGQTGLDAAIDAAGGTRPDGGASAGGVTSSGGVKATGGVQALGGAAGAGGGTGQGGAIDAGNTTSTGGIASTGGITSSGGITSTGGITGVGGTTIDGGTPGPVVCRPALAVINDFSSSTCTYGAWGDGEMNTAAWVYGNGTSTVSATCGSGKWTFAGTLGPATSTGANQAGFGFTPGGYVYDNATNTNVDCTVFDLSAYSGFSITAASASGAIASVGIGVNLADGTKGSTTISVAKTATTVLVTWTQLGIASAARVVEIWGYFQSGASGVTDDLVISGFGLK